MEATSGTGAAVPVAPRSASERSVLDARQLVKTFGEGPGRVEALRGCDITLRVGEITAIVGASGCGKSTLLHVLSGLDSPTSGSIEFRGRRFEDADGRERARWRAKEIGFVLQRDNLIPSLTLKENVAAPMLLSAEPRQAAFKRAEKALDAVGLRRRMNAWPAEVSGGEAQRAAVARACAGDRVLIFADEPTGSLDSDAGRNVLEIFQELVRRSGAAALMVTHDARAAAIADRRVVMSDGLLEEEEPR